MKRRLKLFVTSASLHEPPVDSPEGPIHRASMHRSRYRDVSICSSVCRQAIDG
jgi:hypothetical protein